MNEMTAKEYQSMKKKPRYRNKICDHAGMKFHSQRERDRYIELIMLEATGMISNLRTQVKYELIPKNGKERAVNYIADFAYIEKHISGNFIVVVEDVKSPVTLRDPVYIIKRKLMYAMYGISVREVV